MYRQPKFVLVTQPEKVLKAGGQTMRIKQACKQLKAPPKRCLDSTPEGLSASIPRVLP